MFLSPPDPTLGFSDISLQFETVLPDDETGFMKTLCSNFLPFQTYVKDPRTANSDRKW